MRIEYKITEYFDENDLFDEDTSNGLIIKNNNKSLLIKGDSRDFVELADILASLAKEKEETHIHLDDLTLLNKESDYSELILEKGDRENKTSDNRFLRFISYYLSGLTKMASSCSKWMGVSYMDADCFSINNYKKEFADSYLVDEEDIKLIEVNKSFKQFLEDMFGIDNPKLIDGLVHWIHMEAGEPIKIWNTTDDSKLEEKLSRGSGGQGAFFFMEDIFFVEFEKMAICFMIGNDE